MITNGLGRVFTALRIGRGWTQEEMAVKLQEVGVGISRFGVSKIESRGTQQYALMNAYGQIFDRKVEQLLAEAEAIPQ